MSSLSASSLRDVSNAAIRELLGTRSHSLSIVNLQNGTATFDTTITGTAANMVYSIDGQQFAVAVLSNKALATLAALQTPNTGQAGYYTQPIGSTVYYLAVINAAGTVYVIQGKYSGQVITDASGKSRTVSADEAAQLPFVPVAGTYAPFAAFKVAITVTTPFIPATTFWDATGVLAYATPISVIPSAAVADLTWTAGGA